MRRFFILAFLATVTGCATITRGTTESFVIESNPPGAQATLTNGLQCNTPCSLKVDRRGDFVVTIEKDGYEIVTATVTSSIDGSGGAGMAGNVIFGGIIGAGVDAGSGAMHSHQPNPLSVTLVPIGSLQPNSITETPAIAAEPDRQEVTVDAEMETLLDLRDRGVISESEFESERRRLESPTHGQD